MNLEIEILPANQVSPEIDKAISKVASLAFAEQDINEKNDPSLADIDWSTPMEYMVLGYINKELVTLLGLLRRNILVDDRSVQVVGVSGVATNPAWQKKGYATKLVQYSENFIRNNIAAQFGLLICSEARRKFYSNLGWQYVAGEIFFAQGGLNRKLITPVMILPLSESKWSMGRIDLCGLPW